MYWWLIAIILILFIGLIILAVVLAVTIPINQQYTVQHGVYSIFNTDFCQVLPTCFGQNPATPFARPIFVDQDKPIDTSLLVGAIDMSKNQAVVIYGKRPPSSKYWGFTPYLYDRVDSDADNGRVVVYASLTDTINMNDVPDSAKRLAVVWTRNKVVMDKLAGIYEGQGYYIVRMPVPDVLQPGDRVAMLGRVTYFTSEIEKQAYIKDPGMKADLYTYNSSISYEPYCINLNEQIDNGCINLVPKASSPVEGTKVLTQFETFIAAKLKEYQVVGRYGFNDFLSSQVPGGVNTGYDCINLGVNCQADNRDACYKLCTGLSLTSQTKFLVFGVNHAKFNKAIYASMDVYSADNNYGFDGYLAQDTEQFYAITIGYGEDNTIVVPTEYVNIFLAERAYVQMPQNISPSYDSVIDPIAFVVSV